MKEHDSLYLDLIPEDSNVAETDDDFLSSEGFALLDRKYIVLIIYDITDDRRRVKFAKFLSSFGYRVQKSAFEAKLTKKQYERLRRGIEVRFRKEDNIRIYKFQSESEIFSYGDKDCQFDEEVIFI